MQSTKPPTPRVQFFETRWEARQYCRTSGINQTKIVHNKAAPKARRWIVLS